MNTEAQRRASAEFVAKRKAAGWRKMTFWVSPGVWSELERLKAVHGTRDKALEAILRLGMMAESAGGRLLRDTEGDAIGGTNTPAPGSRPKKR